MNDSIRLAGVCCIAALLIGCGEGPNNMNNRNYTGAFNNIVMEVTNMQLTVNGEWDPRLQPVEDQLGAAVHAFKRNKDVKGTPLEAEAQKLLDQEAKIMEIWQSPEGSVEKIQAAVQEMVDQVEHMKTMI
jgi:hypothetical protein